MTVIFCEHIFHKGCHDVNIASVLSVSDNIDLYNYEINIDNSYLLVESDTWLLYIVQDLLYRYIGYLQSIQSLLLDHHMFLLRIWISIKKK